jgi:hypothetical protein
MLVAVTDHAAERFRQRVAGSLDAKPEIVRRVARAWEAGRCVVYVCRREGDGELVVVTLWEQEGGVAPPRVPRRYTDALKRDDERRRDDDG